MNRSYKRKSFFCYVRATSTSGLVEADHLDPQVLEKVRREGLYAAAVRQDVHQPVTLEVHRYGAVAAPVLEGEGASTLSTLSVAIPSKLSERMCFSRVSPEVVAPRSSRSLAPASPPKMNDTNVNHRSKLLMRRTQGPTIVHSRSAKMTLSPEISS